MGGGTLTHKYGGLYKLLYSVYPEYEWLPWKFNVRPRNFWEDTKTKKKFVEWAGKELKINELSDWYKITNQV